MTDRHQQQLEDDKKTNKKWGESSIKKVKFKHQIECNFDQLFLKTTKIKIHLTSIIIKGITVVKACGKCY